MEATEKSVVMGRGSVLGKRGHRHPGDRCPLGIFLVESMALNPGPCLEGFGSVEAFFFFLIEMLCHRSSGCWSISWDSQATQHTAVQSSHVSLGTSQLLIVIQGLVQSSSRSLGLCCGLSIKCDLETFSRSQQLSLGSVYRQSSQSVLSCKGQGGRPDLPHPSLCCGCSSLRCSFCDDQGFGPLSSPSS